MPSTAKQGRRVYLVGADGPTANRLVFPRLSAVAETGWTDLKAKSWDRFKALFGMMPVLYGKT
jgi:hexosaminidase